MISSYKIVCDVHPKISSLSLEMLMISSLPVDKVASTLDAEASTSLTTW
jgi:hypothetical protein